MKIARLAFDIFLAVPVVAIISTLPHHPEPRGSAGPNFNPELSL